MFTIIGILCIIAGVMFIVEDRAQKKEKKQQQRFNSGSYGLFKEHGWLDKKDRK